MKDKTDKVTVMTLKAAAVILFRVKGEKDESESTASDIYFSESESDLLVRARDSHLLPLSLHTRPPLCDRTPVDPVFN